MDNTGAGFEDSSGDFGTGGNGFDMFGDSLGIQDKEYLDGLRRNKQIENDKWQSRLFERQHCGCWSGESLSTPQNISSSSISFTRV